MDQPVTTRAVMLGDDGHGSAVAVIADRASARLHSAALGLAAEAGAPAADLCERASVLASALPADLVRALHRFGGAGAPREALLVRGVLAGTGGLGPTPGTVTPPPPGPEERAAELTLLAAVSLLGEPFTFASLYGGRLVQHVTAVPGHEDAQTSEGSQADLDWHVEDAFSGDRCDYFGMLCLRGAADAVTAVAAARNLRLPPQAEAVLRQPRFVIDGADRWVLRVMVSASGREHHRRGGIRVLPSASGK
jgi:L-asparagine oxygenase